MRISKGILNRTNVDPMSESNIGNMFENLINFLAVGIHWVENKSKFSRDHAGSDY